MYILHPTRGPTECSGKPMGLANGKDLMSKGQTTPCQAPGGAREGTCGLRPAAADGCNFQGGAVLGGLALRLNVNRNMGHFTTGL